MRLSKVYMTVTEARGLLDFINSPLFGQDVYSFWCQFSASAEDTERYFCIMVKASPVGTHFQNEVLSVERLSMRLNDSGRLAADTTTVFYLMNHARQLLSNSFLGCGRTHGALVLTGGPLSVIPELQILDPALDPSTLVCIEIWENRMPTRRSDMELQLWTEDQNLKSKLVELDYADLLKMFGEVGSVRISPHRVGAPSKADPRLWFRVVPTSGFLCENCKNMNATVGWVEQWPHRCGNCIPVVAPVLGAATSGTLFVALPPLHLGGGYFAEEEGDNS